MILRLSSIDGINLKIIKKLLLQVFIVNLLFADGT